MDTPDFFVGARLAAARAKAGISLEKAAKDTRIRLTKLREIESDDFSGFAHPTYARLFLLDYAEYLGIPQDEIRPLLPDRAGPAGGGFQYIEALSADLPGKGASPRTRRRRIIGLAVALAVVLALGAIGLYTYETLQKIERVAGSKALGELAGGPRRTPQVSDEAAEVPAPTPAQEGVDLTVPMAEPPAAEVFVETTLDLTVPIPSEAASPSPLPSPAATPTQPGEPAP